MSREEFVRTNRDTWRRLSELLDQVDRSGMSSLDRAQLSELGRVYRRATGHLSESRTTQYDSEITEYLNQLVSRAYARIYAGSRPRRLGIIELFAVQVPRTFRKRAGYIGTSVALSLLAASLAYFAVRTDPRWAPALVGPRATAMWEQFAAGDQAAGEYFARAAEELRGPEFAGLLMSNNIQVALKAFAFGIAIGLGTVYVLIVNGIMLGAFFGIAGNAGALQLFASVVAPHGILELSAIFVAGGAGLLLGHSIVDPGDMYRRDAVRLAAADAIKLLLGTVPMFVVAGIVEGMISPQHTSLFAHDGPRILFGCAVACALWLCAFFGDRFWGGDEARAPEP